MSRRQHNGTTGWALISLALPYQMQPQSSRPAKFKFEPHEASVINCRAPKPVCLCSTLVLVSPDLSDLFRLSTVSYAFLTPPSIRYFLTTPLQFVPPSLFVPRPVSRTLPPTPFPAFRLLHSHADLSPPLDRCSPKQIVCRGHPQPRLHLNPQQEKYPSGRQSEQASASLLAFPSAFLEADKERSSGCPWTKGVKPYPDPPAERPRSTYIQQHLLDLTESRVQSVAAVCIIRDWEFADLTWPHRVRHHTTPPEPHLIRCPYLGKRSPRALRPLRKLHPIKIKLRSLPAALSKNRSLLLIIRSYPRRPSLYYHGCVALSSTQPL